MNRIPFAALVLVLALVPACSPAAPIAPTQDISAIKTSVARTVVAEITLTASAFTATAVPPTETATPDPGVTGTLAVTNAAGTAVGTQGALCDSMTFNPATVDVNVPDLSRMTKGQQFVKTWKVRNDGSCAWGDGYGLVFAYGERMGGVPQPFETVVAAGQEVEISVNFKAPSLSGEYVSAWQMTNSNGVAFGKPVYVKVIVN